LPKNISRIRRNRVDSDMPPTKRFSEHVNLGLTAAQLARLDRVLDKRRGETRLDAIRAAIDALVELREVTKLRAKKWRKP
jgi:hypothetical protein